jgi:NAD(P)-dependent dehydrogenase (short-subunit alcohol dehydrogenase family)
MGKVVLLTGVSGTLGALLCGQLIDGGYIVYGISRSSNWSEVKAKTNNSNQLHLHNLDVTDEAAVNKLVDLIISEQGKLDILINNAAHLHERVRFEETSNEEYDLNFDINVRGVFNTCKVAIPHMINDGESVILNMSSMAGVRSVPGLGIYSATKFAVSGMTQAMAKENYDNNIKCFTVSPGGMNTSMRAKAFGAEDAKKQQAPEKVSDIIYKLITGETPIKSGSDVAVRFESIIGITKSPDY